MTGGKRTLERRFNDNKKSLLIPSLVASERPVENKKFDLASGSWGEVKPTAGKKGLRKLSEPVV